MQSRAFHGTPSDDSSLRIHYQESEVVVCNSYRTDEYVEIPDHLRTLYFLRTSEALSVTFNESSLFSTAAGPSVSQT